jgi:hypothetical protein
VDRVAKSERVASGAQHQIDKQSSRRRRKSAMSGDQFINKQHGKEHIENEEIRRTDPAG